MPHRSASRPRADVRTWTAMVSRSAHRPTRAGRHRERGEQMLKGINGRAAAVAAAVVVGSLASAAPSQAGQYTIDVCREWGTEAPGAVPLGLSARGFDHVQDLCSTAGPLEGQLGS